MTEQYKTAAREVANEFDASIFLYSGSIDDNGFAQLLTFMQPSFSNPLRANSILILTTHGGDPNAAYKIARLLQKTSQDFIVCVPAICKSAGTLIALGATELWMQGIAEIGPLDVQLIQRDEIGQRRSGLVGRAAFDGLSDEAFHTFEKIMLAIKAKSFGTISFETASRIAANITSAVMAPIYAQISPDSLGNDLRDLNIAKAYGDRLAGLGGNTVPDCVLRLVSSYPSHDFIIDREEAESLFIRVREPPDSVAALVRLLRRAVYVEQEPAIITRLDQEGEHDSEDSEEHDGTEGAQLVAGCEGPG
ncbi:MAG: hypothetical protein GVY13_10770 [Alphaproteobacteria bacterium]|jgi:hypothetical protein|nr:hypothetical protein [Alphaproteobacteria bacterium]